MGETAESLADTSVSSSLLTFLQLLTGPRNFEASKPRDKVFAFYGITDGGVAAELARTCTPETVAGSRQTLGGRISSRFSNVGSSCALEA
jgi:hypothetical protein